MLIPVPFAFLTGGWAFAVAGALARNREYRTVADHLVPTGVAAGLAAAVPGLVDYRGSVPPDSSARTRALKHALLNTTALGLFTIGWLAGRRANGRAVSLLLQTAGVAAISAGGWMGGTLVYRNQIGVDHRYARAGKWKEETGGEALGEAAQGLEPDQMKLVHRDGERIVVARTGSGHAAFHDRCTHKGGPLSDGALICGVVQCPWHGSQFDVRTGEVKCGPAEEPIRIYDVTSRDVHRPHESSRP